MTMRATIRVISAAPYEGKPVWRGQYRIGDSWLTLYNAAGLPIAYASEDSARLAAEWTQAKILKGL